MRCVGQGLRTALTYGVIFLMSCGIASVEAEVGVDLDNQSGVSHATRLGSIVDDPDPVPELAPVHKIVMFGGSQAIVNPGGYENGDGYPSVVYDTASRLPIVAWARKSATGFDVVVSCFRNRAWSKPQVVAGSPDDELGPDLVVGPNGQVHLFYWVSGVSPRVMHSQAPADLSSWSEPVQVSSQGELTSQPAGAYHRGDLYVAYEAHDFGFGEAPQRIVLARLQGNGFRSENVALTNNPGEARPEVHSERGRLWVEWLDASATPPGILAWRRLGPRGLWEPIESVPFDTREDRDSRARRVIRSLVVRMP